MSSSREQMARPALSRINNVQALRGFAALLVVLGHSGWNPPGLMGFGTFGVDIFFVISGFIMAMIVARNPDKFFLRRLIRILPLYWTATFGVFVLAAWKPNLMMHTRANWGELALSLLFIPFFKNGATNVASPVLFVGWTLNYEMFFYVVLALCLLVSRKWAAWMACAAIVITMLVCRPFGLRYAATMLYSDPIILEFVLGVLAYHAATSFSAERCRHLRWPAGALLVLAALFMVSVQATRLWPPILITRLVPFGVPSFFLVASAAVLSRGGADTRLRLLVLLGDASYVIYILHTYVLDGFNRVLAHRWPALKIDHAPGCLLSMALVTSLSVLIYLRAEKPAVDWLSDKFGTRRIPKAEVKDPAESMA
jgi:peptidoglycan/LPS O-acetylase OafA/YrhL